MKNILHWLFLCILSASSFSSGFSQGESTKVNPKPLLDDPVIQEVYETLVDTKKDIAIEENLLKKRVATLVELGNVVEADDLMKEVTAILDQKEELALEKARINIAKALMRQGKLAEVEAILNEQTDALFKKDEVLTIVVDEESGETVELTLSENEESVLLKSLCSIHTGAYSDQWPYFDLVLLGSSIVFAITGTVLLLAKKPMIALGFYSANILGNTFVWASAAVRKGHAQKHAHIKSLKEECAQYSENSLY
ncbi:MAG: hypothetical protein OXC44_02885 [Proteobacteria bacterium]|nr:hypothetical protein [Pseudomonadota bacterium]